MRKMHDFRHPDAAGRALASCPRKGGPMWRTRTGLWPMAGSRPCCGERGHCAVRQLQSGQSPRLGSPKASLPDPLLGTEEAFRPLANGRGVFFGNSQKVIFEHILSFFWVSWKRRTQQRVVLKIFEYVLSIAYSKHNKCSSRHPSSVFATLKNYSSLHTRLSMRKTNTRAICLVHSAVPKNLSSTEVQKPQWPLAQYDAAPTHRTWMSIPTVGSAARRSAGRRRPASHEVARAACATPLPEKVQTHLVFLADFLTPENIFDFVGEPNIFRSLLHTTTGYADISIHK